MAAVLFLVSSDKHTGPGAVALQHACAVRDAGHEVLFCCLPGGSLEERARKENLFFSTTLRFPRGVNVFSYLHDRRCLQQLHAQTHLGAVFVYRTNEHLLAHLAFGRHVPVVRYLRPSPKLDAAADGCGRVAQWLGASAFLTPLLSRLNPQLPDFDTPDAASRVSLLMSAEDKRAPLWACIPGGLDTEVFSPAVDGSGLRREWGLAEEDVLVGLVARMKPERGHLRFLQIFAEATKRVPQLRGLLVGTGACRNEIEAQMQTLGIADRMQVVVPEERFVQTVAALDLAMLFHPGSAGNGRAALELMAMGTPVVCAGEALRAMYPWFSPCASDAPETDALLVDTLVELAQKGGAYRAWQARGERFVQQVASSAVLKAQLARVLDLLTGKADV